VGLGPGGFAFCPAGVPMHSGTTAQRRRAGFRSIRPEVGSRCFGR
jgi:hypothetical protein